VTQAEHVDHVIPWRSIGPAAFKRNLFQSLCENCHSVKTALEQKGVFIHYSESGPKEYTRADYLVLVQK
jgi:5-methylcytosine-specific restriction endonuclease McrA